MKLKHILPIVAIALALLPGAAFADAPFYTFAFDNNGDPIWTQSAYLPAGVVDGFDRPEDIFIDIRDQVYVADTGNARIVVYDSWGNYLRTIGEGVLSRPTGVFVDDEGSVYAADYRKEKIFLFAGDGTLVSEYGRPASRLFGKNSPFKPLKVIADKRKNMYVVGEGTIDGLIQINREGEFVGYFGGNKTGFSLKRYLQRIFYTKTQMDKLMKQLPPSATNAAIDGEGLVYTSTVGTNDEGIKKLNVAGKNLLENVWTFRDLADIAVDSHGSIYTVDAFRGYVTEYDQDGRVLYIFGGTDAGSQRFGLFKSPSGIAVSSDGRLFVSDKQRNNVQILQPTEFTGIMHEAIAYYMDGKYAESEQPWRNVLRLNSMFDIAHTGLGMSAMKQDDYAKALEQFRLANNKEEFSNAYWEIRRVWLMRHASKFLIGIALFLAALAVMSRLHRKYGFGRRVTDGWNRFKRRKLVMQLLHTFRLMRHPIDGYYELEAEGKASVLSATVLLVLLFAVRLFELYQTNFLFADWDVRKISITSEAMKTYLPFFAWVVSNYLVSAINDGEGKFKDIYKGTVYALSPYILFAAPTALFSQGLTWLEAVLYNFASGCVTVYSGFLLFMMVKEIHGYEIGQTIKNIFLTAVGMLVMALLAFILFGLSSQVTDFVYSLFQEVKYRVYNA